ncbi:30S ribosomal protein S17e [Candidatus Woesearchaeota archaeon]|nr:30S ribosomal protein S17e [Candidatus Woesearchaeota archaeon]
MGRIKTLPIKRITGEIFESYKDKLTGDYAKNKEFLEKIAEIKSKKIRNIIAGYLTRMVKSNAA